MKLASPFLGLALTLIAGSAVWLRHTQFVAAARITSATAARQTPPTVQWRKTGKQIDERTFSMASVGADIFAGTEGGVWRSQDRGDSWTQVNNLSSFNVPSLRNFPLVVSNTHLLVRANDVSNNGGVYLTEDSGQSWRLTNLNSILATAFGVSGTTLVTQLVPDVPTPSGNYPIYQSTDGGQSWRNIVNRQFSARAFVFQGGNLFAGTEFPGGVHRSTDNGLTWQVAGGGFAPRSVLKLAATDSTLLAYVAIRQGANSFAPNGVHISTNGGQSFEPVSGLPPSNHLRDFAVGGTNVFAAVEGRGVYYSSDRGATWTQVNDGLTNFQVQALTISGGQIFVAALGTGAKLSDIFVANIPSNCSYSITPTNQAFTAAAGSGSVTVNTEANCNWTATSNANWLTLTSGASGTGSGVVNYTVAANPSLESRSGTLTIAGQTVTVTQAGVQPHPVPVLANLSPASVFVGSSAFSLTVNGANFVNGAVVRWNDADRPTTFVNAGQLVAQIPASDLTNAGVANVRVFNPAPGGGLSTSLSFTITTCGYSLQPQGQTFAASGGSGTVAVNTIPGCAWTVTSNANWLTITGGASGTGAGSLGYSVNPNIGPARMGTMTIAGQTFTVTQDSGCGYTLAPTSQSFDATGGTGSVQVNTASGCTWTATSNDTWLALTGGANGTGNGAVGYTVAANTGANLRTGSLTIAGQNFSVTQVGITPNPAPSLISLSPGALLAGSEAFTLTVNGEGFVNGSIVRWKGSGRSTTFESSTRLSATIPAADVEFAGAAEISVFTPAPGGGVSNVLMLQINNPVPVITSLNPNSTDAGSPGFTLSVQGTNFVLGSVVRWNGAERSTTFNSRSNLTVTLPASDFSRAGTANVQVFNPTPGGGASNVSTFTITCAYAIQSASQSFGESGGTASVQVTASEGCPWTAVSNAAWITVTTGQTGSGNGAVSCNIAANPTVNARSGTVTIAGRIFTVTQAGTVCPTVSSISPNTGPVGTPITITGTNFTGVTTVKFAGGATAQFTLVNDTQINASVPNGAQTGAITLSKAGCNDVQTGVFTVPVNITISGTVTYALGNNSPPVAAVELAARNENSDAVSTATTAHNGRYNLTNLSPGSYRVTLQKNEPGAVNGLSALDAARILRGLQQANLNRLERLAADIDRDGFITQDDVQLLLRKLVGLENSGQAGRWRFDPESRSYFPLQASQVNQDYQAILIGDVTGNWTPSMATLAITGIEPRASQGEAAGWLIQGRQFKPGLTLVLFLPSGGELQLSGEQIQNLNADSFAVPLRLGLPGLWTLQVVNPDGQASPLFSFLWPLVP